MKNKPALNGVGSMPLLDAPLLLSQYFALKKKAKAIKAERRELHQEDRDCERPANGDHEEEYNDCYQTERDESEWCDFCKKRQEICRRYYETLNEAQSIYMKLYHRYGQGA